MSAYYHIYTDSGKEITDSCVSLSYEESQGKDDMLVLKLRDKFPYPLVDDVELKKGAKLRFVFGVSGGNQSGYKFAKIAAINRSYTASGVSIELRCLDDGFVMKRKERQDVWRNKTISDIIREIAFRSGMDANIEGTSLVYEYLPQNGMTDWAFCKKLASMADGGDFRCFVRAGKLHFIKTKLDEKSNVVFDFSPNGNILSFVIGEKGNEQSSESSSVFVRGFDALTGKKYEKKVDASEAKDTKLGDYDISIDENGKEIGVKPSLSNQRNTGASAGKTLPVVSGSQGETENIGNNLYKSESLNGFDCSLVTFLDPILSCDIVISVKGVALSDSGNYYVESVTHSITGQSHGTTTLKLKRNASNIKQSDGQEKLGNPKNKTVPASGEQNKKDVIKYNENGIEVK